MAKRIFRNAQVIVDSVDLSDFVVRVNMNDSRTKVDTTAVSKEFRQYIAGLRDVSITLDMIQDYDSGSVDTTIYPIYNSNSGNTGVLEIIPDKNSAISRTNPRFVMESVVTSYKPVGGSTNEPQKTSATFVPSSELDGGLLVDYGNEDWDEINVNFNMLYLVME